MNTLRTAVGVIVYLRGNVNTLQTAQGWGQVGCFTVLKVAGCQMSRPLKVAGCQMSRPLKVGGMSDVPTIERCEVSYVPTFGRGG